ncbi:MAG: glycoside hydrolase [Gammaproteobacteria bacterium]
MSGEPRLKVVLCWHMHQPQYRDLIRDSYQLPWTYLHGIKDYVDMAAHLEAVPAARAVVNFAPVLLEQIEDYARQVRAHLENGAQIRDPLLAALAGPDGPSGSEARADLIAACLRANPNRLIGRFPAYQRLVELAHCLGDISAGVEYASDQYLADLLVWYHLAWTGETVRRQDTRIKRLENKATGYTLADRRQLLGVIGEQLSGLIGRYRVLAERGQVELAVSPYAHPILPLLLELGCAREALPDVPLPMLEGYPGGRDRARWHVRAAIECFERHFGMLPKGCWPSEGGVSQATLKLLEEHGFQWTASGQGVLANSCNRRSGAATDPEGAYTVHQPYRLKDGRIACFFRDDGLSDLIGFTYSDWHADDAVANLVHHLEAIAGASRERPNAVVSIVLDGENAWEYYPENGYHFLSALYRRLAEHPQLELTTFSAALGGSGPPAELPRLVAGSWVYGTFSTWIGDPDKNRGWDMLGAAKRTYDAAFASGQLSDEQCAKALEQLAICEGSDWFWWFGDYNPADTVRDFDSLYRRHLSALYRFLGKEPPSYLDQPFTHGGGAPRAGGTMRPGQAQS